jgi:hypothetical protein
MTNSISGGWVCLLSSWASPSLDSLATSGIQGQRHQRLYELVGGDEVITLLAEWRAPIATGERKPMLFWFRTSHEQKKATEPPPGAITLPPMEQRSRVEDAPYR